MKNLIDIKHLSKKQVDSIFNCADELKNAKIEPVLTGKVICLLFFENSTRTLASFELAAKKLGATVLNLDIAKSSTKKGESLRDTIQTIQAMGVDAFVIRHSENKICESISQWLKPHVKLINAGDGNNQHPTQALLDFYTIRDHYTDFHKLNISIIGDIKHSRVAKSFLDLSKTLNIKSITVFGPPELLPKENNDFNQAETMTDAISGKDVVILLRIQKERIDDLMSINFENYNENYGFKNRHLMNLNRNSIILHPGPFNRDVEIDSNVAEHPQSAILEQVENGVFIRQAVLIKLLTNHIG